MQRLQQELVAAHDILVADAVRGCTTVDAPLVERCAELEDRTEPCRARCSEALRQPPSTILQPRGITARLEPLREHPGVLRRERNDIFEVERLASWTVTPRNVELHRGEAKLPEAGQCGQAPRTCLRRRRMVDDCDAFLYGHDSSWKRSRTFSTGPVR